MISWVFRKCNPGQALGTKMRTVVVGLSCHVADVPPTDPDAFLMQG